MWCTIVVLRGTFPILNFTGAEKFSMPKKMYLMFPKNVLSSEKFTKNLKMKEKILDDQWNKPFKSEIISKAFYRAEGKIFKAHRNKAASYLDL